VVRPPLGSRPEGPSASVDGQVDDGWYATDRSRKRAGRRRRGPSEASGADCPAGDRRRYESPTMRGAVARGASDRVDHALTSANTCPVSFWSNGGSRTSPPTLRPRAITNRSGLTRRHSTLHELRADCLHARRGKVRVSSRRDVRRFCWISLGERMAPAPYA
jgi:hypothetical protein